MASQAGDNHAIELVDGVVHVRVWKRPDLDHETGARNAHQIERSVLGWLEHSPQGLCLDVSEAPETAGPKTQASLGGLFAAYAQRGLPIAVLAGDSALRRMQYGRVLSETAGALGRVCWDRDEADAHLGA